MKNKLYTALAAVRDWDVDNFKQCSRFTLPQSLRRKVKAALDTVEQNGHIAQHLHGGEYAQMPKRHFTMQETL